MRRPLGRRARSVLALAALGLVGSACLRGDPVRRSWHEVRTQRFVLVTDMVRSAARERARELDRLAAVLGDLYEIVRPEPSTPLRPARVVHFARCSDLRPLSAREVDGFVRRAHNLGGERLIVTCESRHWSETAIHELTHDINARYFALPAWLEEGLAEYYSTIEIDEGVAVVGRAPRQYDRVWRSEVPLPRLGRLLTMPYRQLVDVPSARGYFAAWYLTQILATSSPDYTRRFQRLLASLAEGADSNAAFAAAFGDVAADIARAYRDLGERRQLIVRHVPYRNRTAGGIVGDRRLRRGEVHALFIELAPSGPGLKASLAARVDDMEREDGTWPGRLYWRAMVGAIGGSGEKASGRKSIALLREYVRQVPDDGQGWAALVSFEIGERVTGEKGPGLLLSSGLEEIEDDVRRLVDVASTPSHFRLVALYHALRRQPAVGLSFARRALALEPSCAPCWEVLARIHFDVGDVREAIAAQERAIALVVRHARPGAMTQRLRHYRRAASSASPAGPRPR